MRTAMQTTWQQTWRQWQRVIAQAMVGRKLAFAVLVAVLLVGLTAPFAALHVQAAPARKSPVYTGTPHHFQPPPKPDRSGPYPGPPPQHMVPVSPSTDTTIHHPFTPSMKELMIPLTRLYAASPNQPPRRRAWRRI
jgi:hypothetical protein